MSSSFVRIGFASVCLVGSLCWFGPLGCSGDASLGGHQKEQNADEQDTAGDDGSSGAEESASAGSDSTTSNGTSSVQTASASSVNGVGGGPESAGGAGGTVTTEGSVSVGGSRTDGESATSGGGSSDDGSITDGGTGGATNGSGGAGGSGSTTGGSGGASSGETTGTGSAACEMYQCARPIECVESCGGPILKSSCCPCEPGTFDQFQCPIADCASSADCESYEYCHFEGETCGEDGTLGTCRGRILLCPAVVAPACGCDLVLYESECAAAYAGVSVTALERCSEN